MSTPITDGACDAVAKIFFDDPQLSRGVWVGRATAERLERDRAMLIQALQYCAVEPARLHPLNNVQHAVALNALSAIREFVEDA